MRTVGVEEEFLLVTRSGADLLMLGPQVVERAADGDAIIEAELKAAQAETGSAPSGSAAELEGELRRLRGVLASAAERLGARLCALATSPHSGRAATTARARYLRMTDRFGILARQQLACGQHVHVSVADRAEGVRVIDAIQPWLPVVRALAANSPFWQGEDTGYASYRTILWNQWPTAGPTEPFGSPQAYAHRVDELIASGAALDEAMIYFDARLSAKYPTVEIRVADVSTELSTALMIGLLCRALVDRVAAGDGSPHTPALLRAATWRAARDGLAGYLIDPRTSRPAPARDAVERLLEFVGPSLGEDANQVTGEAQRLLATGTGADRQRINAPLGLDAMVLDACDRTLVNP